MRRKEKYEMSDLMAGVIVFGAGWLVYKLVEWLSQ
jgi:hypothetical protein